MKGQRLLRIFRHGFNMVRKNLRSYTLLSVTILLSFSLLLGFMGYLDTSLYNEYKGTFSINRGNLLFREGEGSTAQFNRLLELAQELQNTRFYVVYSASTSSWITGDRMETSEGNILGPSASAVFFLPSHVWQFFYWLDEPVEVRWLDGSPHNEINLKPDEAIMDTASFYALGLNQMEEPWYCFHLHKDIGDYGTMLEKDVKIVGLIDQPGEFFSREGGELTYNSPEAYSPTLLLSEEGVTKAQLEAFGHRRYVVFYSEVPEQVAALAKSLGYELGPANAAYELHNAALEKIQTQKATKAIIAGALLLILGVNLYSSFSNALNDRKFEIGVKRAIGASSFQIVRQFLYESLMVMAVNILLSIAIVVDVGLVFKLVMENIHVGTSVYQDYILYISPYSAAMFSICAVTLMVVFSLIFAYKSTQVEIVQYLKAE